MMIGPREPDAAMPASFEELRRRAELLEAREASDPASATEPLTDDLRAFLEAEDRLGDFLGGLDPDSADPDAAPAPDVPADTPGELAPGEICGDCRIIRWVGAGGMGEVYEAEDLGLSMSDTPAAATGRRVALKVLPQWWLGRRARVAESALRREVATISRLRHPGIAVVHRAGVDRSPERPGRPLAYLVMEFVDGRPLLQHPPVVAAAAAASTSERPALALQLGLRLAEAVAASHAARVVHRDLTSGNVLVRDDGSLVVVDFGLARLLREDDPAAPRHTMTLTAASGQLDGAGTLGAISPERARGEEAVGTQEDVWAIGVLLHHLLLGRPPIDLAGLPVFEALRRIGERPPAPVRSAAGWISRDLATVVDRCLAFDPGDRYPDAEAVRRELDRVARGLPPEARPLGPLARGLRAVRRHPLPAAAAAILVLGLVASTAGFARVASVTEAARVQEQDSRRRVFSAANTLLADIESVLAGQPVTLPVRMQLAEAVVAYVRTAAPDRTQLTAEEAMDLASVLAMLVGVRGEAEIKSNPEDPAIPVIQEAIGLLEYAAGVGGTTPERLGRAIRTVHEATWYIGLPADMVREIREERFPPLVAGVLEADPGQPDAEFIRLRLRLNESNVVRIAGDPLRGIAICEEVLAGMRALRDRMPEDGEIADGTAAASSGLAQSIFFHRQNGGERIPEAEALAAIEDAAIAMERSGAIESRIRRMAGDLWLTVIRAHEGIGDPRELMASMDTLIAKVKTLAAEEPNYWQPRRHVVLYEVYATLVAEWLADREADPELRRSLLLWGRSHGVRLLDTVRERIARDGFYPGIPEADLSFAEGRITALDAALAALPAPRPREE